MNTEKVYLEKLRILEAQFLNPLRLAFKEEDKELLDKCFPSVGALIVLSKLLLEVLECGERSIKGGMDVGPHVRQVSTFFDRLVLPHSINLICCIRCHLSNFIFLILVQLSRQWETLRNTFAAIKSQW